MCIWYKIIINVKEFNGYKGEYWISFWRHHKLRRDRFNYCYFNQLLLLTIAEIIRKVKQLNFYTEYYII